MTGKKCSGCCLLDSKCSMNGGGCCQHQINVFLIAVFRAARPIPEKWKALNKCPVIERLI